MGVGFGYYLGLFLEPWFAYVLGGGKLGHGAGRPNLSVKCELGWWVCLGLVLPDNFLMWGGEAWCWSYIEKCKLGWVSYLGLPGLFGALLPLDDASVLEVFVS